MTKPEHVVPGYRYQLSKECFDFDIIKRTRNFKKYQKVAMRYGLIRDICDPSLSDVDEVSLDKYLNIEQKSKTWFKFRAAADGTASSVGKKIKGPTTYPTMEQVSEQWMDLLTKKPFEVTHTMAGHMKWGVGYEDPALVHFAIDNMLSVAQVGTIHMPLNFVLGLVTKYVPDLLDHKTYIEAHTHGTAHLLVSPDGLVGYPDDGELTELSTELLGMLEIKCISPFHHIEENGTLSWVDDMETRQWYNAGEIPFVYITQICMQALSGLHQLNMTEDHTMWFIRWSPIGFSEFKVTFGPLLKMGIIATMLYFRLKSRLLSPSDLPLEYTTEEAELSQSLYGAYKEVISSMSHRYVRHENLYPEFQTYRNCTQLHRFVVS